MAEPIETTEWRLFKESAKDSSGGNYIFLFNKFACAPYYAGEANNFEDRFTRTYGGHANLFRRCGRTFMRAAFSEQAKGRRSHQNFAQQWMHYQAHTAPEEKEKFVWVPNGSFSQVVSCEGSRFWAEEVTRLIFQNAYEPVKRRRIESRIQQDIMCYYEGLTKGHSIDWRLPPRSRLVGRGSRVPMPPVMYRLNGGAAMESGTFFESLQHMLVEQVVVGAIGPAVDEV